MQQKLILPLNRTLVTASMGNAAYRAKFGFPHYGTDMVSAVGDTTIYASGTGTLIAAGWDKYAGNVVVIRYPGAVYRPDGTAADVSSGISIWRRSGRSRRENAITKDTILGQLWRFGAWAARVTGARISWWKRTPCRYPRYSPTFTPSGEILFGRAAGRHCRNPAGLSGLSLPQNLRTRPSDLPDGRCALCGSEGLCHSGAA